MAYENYIIALKLQESLAGTPGYNEYGIPRHACHGYRHDEHYWAYVGTLVIL